VARDDAAPPHPDPTPPPLSLNLKIRRRGRKAEPRRPPSLPPGAGRELRRLPPSWARPRAAGPPPPQSTPRRALGCCRPAWNSLPLSRPSRQRDLHAAGIHANGVARQRTGRSSPSGWWANWAIVPARHEKEAIVSCLGHQVGTVARPDMARKDHRA
jgi:hypothetical protein